MNLGTGDKKKTMMAAGFGVVALGAVVYMYTEIFGGTSAPPPVAPVAVRNPPTIVTTSSTTSSKGVSTPSGFAVGGAAAAKIASTSGQLDPTLHEDAMHLTESVVYSGSGRNIFGAGQTIAEVKIPVAVKPARTVTVAAVAPGPYVPPPYVPPPIDLKFFGTATAANGDRRAFLLHGDDVFIASPGEIVQRRYKVVSIAANSIVIDDMPNNNKQTLPLQAN